MDGFSFAYTSSDLPLESIRAVNGGKYCLNSVRLKTWTKAKFIYLHESLGVLSLELAES